MVDDIGFVNIEEWFNLVEIVCFNFFGGEEEVLFDFNFILNFFQDDFIVCLSWEEVLVVNINWFDQILDQGNYQDINVLGIKGFEGGNMYVFFGYCNDNSVLCNNGLECYFVCLNLQFNFFENLSVEICFNFSYMNNDCVKQQVGGVFGNNSGGNSVGWGNVNWNVLFWYFIFNFDYFMGYWNFMLGNNLVVVIDWDMLVDEVMSYCGMGGLVLEY